MENILKKLKVLHPELEILEFLKVKKTNCVRVKNEYGECIVQKHSLLSGSKPTISTAINKNEYFKNQLKKIHPNITLLSDYTGSQNKVKIKTDYGECYSIATHLLKGKPISIDIAINKSEFFEILSKEKHGNKYDYSKVDYIDNEHKIKIICPEHGEFEQIPHNHLKGYGCLKCSGRDKSGGWYNNHNNLHKISNFYIINISNKEENFMKFGVSIDVNKRVGQILRESKKKYTIQIVKIITNTADYCSKVENKFRKKVDLINHKYTKYVPKIHFTGKYECFKIKF